MGRSRFGWLKKKHKKKTKTMNHPCKYFASTELCLVNPLAGPHFLQDFGLGVMTLAINPKLFAVLTDWYRVSVRNVTDATNVFLLRANRSLAFKINGSRRFRETGIRYVGVDEYDFSFLSASTYGKVPSKKKVVVQAHNHELPCRQDRTLWWGTAKSMVCRWQDTFMFVANGFETQKSSTELSIVSFLGNRTPSRCRFTSKLKFVKLRKCVSLVSTLKKSIIAGAACSHGGPQRKFEHRLTDLPTLK